MKKMFDRFLNNAKFWLSYWPTFFSFGLNCGILVGNLNYPSKIAWLQNLLILFVSIGITINLKSFHFIYSSNKRNEKTQQEFHFFMLSLEPQIKAIMQEEMEVEGREPEISLPIAGQRIQALIDSELANRKTLADESKTGKT